MNKIFLSISLLLLMVISGCATTDWGNSADYSAPPSHSSGCH